MWFLSYIVASALVSILIVRLSWRADGWSLRRCTQKCLMSALKRASAILCVIVIVEVELHICDSFQAWMWRTRTSLPFQGPQMFTQSLQLVIRWASASAAPSLQSRWRYRVPVSPFLVGLWRSDGRKSDFDFTFFVCSLDHDWAISALTSARQTCLQNTVSSLTDRVVYFCTHTGLLG